MVIRRPSSGRRVRALRSSFLWRHLVSYSQADLSEAQQVAHTPSQTERPAVSIRGRPLEAAGMAAGMAMGVGRPAARRSRVINYNQQTGRQYGTSVSPRCSGVRTHALSPPSSHRPRQPPPAAPPPLRPSSRQALTHCTGTRCRSKCSPKGSRSSSLCSSCRPCPRRYPRRRWGRPGTGTRCRSKCSPKGSRGSSLRCPCAGGCSRRGAGHWPAPRRARHARAARKPSPA